GQQLRLALDAVRHPRFDSSCDPRVQCLTRATQQRAIGSVLHQRMLEQVARIWRHSLPEQQTSRNEAVERRSQLRLRLTHHRSQQIMGELAAYGRADLGYLLNRAEPVEPRDQ